MADVLMSPEKMPSKFSMTEEVLVAARPRAPRWHGLVRAARQTAERLRPWPVSPARRRRESSAAAW